MWVGSGRGAGAAATPQVMGWRARGFSVLGARPSLGQVAQPLGMVGGSEQEVRTGLLGVHGLNQRESPVISAHGSLGLALAAPTDRLLGGGLCRGQVGEVIVGPPGARGCEAPR